MYATGLSLSTKKEQNGDDSSSSSLLFFRTSSINRSPPATFVDENKLTNGESLQKVDSFSFSNVFAICDYCAFSKLGLVLHWCENCSSAICDACILDKGKKIDFWSICWSLEWSSSPDWLYFDGQSAIESHSSERPIRSRRAFPLGMVLSFWLIVGLEWSLVADWLSCVCLICIGNHFCIRI